MTFNTKEYTYLFSSYERLPESYFQGYCFVDNDLILDAKGAEQYNKTITPFHDGCYFSISKRDNRYILGVDSNGFNRIFYYNLNGIWAVSNSVLILAKYLHSKGVKLTRNYAALASLFNVATVTNQISTLRTVFNEIKLLPYQSFIEINSNQLIIRPKSHQEDKGYIKNLKVYIETWLSRIETIITNNEINVVSELTGGVDSRTVYSLFYAAFERLGDSNINSLYIRSSNSPDFIEDFTCAKKITERYYGKLNINPPTKRLRLPTSEAYQKWKVINLGNNSPFYVPGWSPSSDLLHFGGGGGEAHNAQYGHRTVEQFTKNIKNRILSSYEVKKDVNLEELLNQHMINFKQDIEVLRFYSINRNLNPLMLNYREFRNRFHAGRAPLYGRTVAPLASEYLNTCSSYCDKSKLASRQILYDIIGTLCPGLLIMPYDTDAKFPSIEDLKNLTIIPYSKKSNPGRVYKKTDVDDVKIEKDAYKYSHLYYLEKDLDEFIENYDNEFFSDRYIQEAKATMSEARVNNRFKHAVKAAPVVQILTYKMMLDYASE